jgi:aspartate aminotransferase
MTIVRARIEAMEDSPILDVWRVSRAAGDDVISMIAGEPDVPTPRFICDAATAALNAGHTFYTDNRGIRPLRDSIARYLKRLYGADVADERIAVTSSGMTAVQIICQAVLGPGDRAVAVTPSWPNVMRAMTIAGAEVDEVPLARNDNGWALDLRAVEEACRRGARMLYVASPANPTGWAISRGEAEAILKLVRDVGLVLVADEVYHRIVYDRPAAFSFLEIARPDDPVFVVNSFSKSWAMSGWRLGWMISPSGLAPNVEKLVQFNTSGAPAFLQYGALAAIEEGEPFVAEFVDRCRTGREIVSRRLKGMKRVREIANNGSFYSMFSVGGVKDTIAFCKELAVEARIGLAPGAAFGKGAEGLIRLCYAKTAPLIETAMDRLEAHLAR